MDELNMKIKALVNFKLKILLQLLLFFFGVILYICNINLASGTESMSKNYLYTEEYYSSADEQIRLEKVIYNVVDILSGDKKLDGDFFGEEWMMAKKAPVLDRFFTDGFIGTRWFRVGENLPWNECIITRNQNKLFVSFSEKFFSDALNLELESVTQHKTTVIEVDANDNDIEVEKPYLSYNYKSLEKKGVLVSFIVMGKEKEKYPINFLRVEIKKQ